MDSNNQVAYGASLQVPQQQLENLVCVENKEIVADEANTLLTDLFNSTKERSKTLLEKKTRVDDKKGYYEVTFEKESNEKTAQSIKSFIGLPTAESIKDALTTLNSLYTKSFKDQAKFTADLYNYTTEILNILQAVIFIEAIAFDKIKSNTNSIERRAEKINELAERLEKGSCSINDLLDYVIESASDVEEANQKFSDELIQLNKDIVEIKESLKNNVNADDLSQYALLEGVYSKDEIDDLKEGFNNSLNNYVDKNDIHAKLNKLWIAYGTTTAILLAGLIASFLI